MPITKPVASSDISPPCARLSVTNILADWKGAGFVVWVAAKECVSKRTLSSSGWSDQDKCRVRIRFTRACSDEQKEESRTSKHVDRKPNTACIFSAVQIRGETYSAKYIEGKIWNVAMMHQYSPALYSPRALILPFLFLAPSSSMKTVGCNYKD